MDKKLKALIVEDSEEDALLVAMELKRSGYDLVHERVDTPESFGSALDTGAWDIVLCDYAMPRFSGPAALEILHKKRLDIPFIVVSGSIGEVTAVALMKAGAHDYIMKDRLSRLAPAIDRELAEAVVRREREQLVAALLDSEKSLKEAQRIARVGSWSLDLATDALAWSDETYRIFEVDPDRSIASFEAFLDNIHPEDREYVEKAYTESLNKKQPYDIVHRLLMADGRVKYVNERCETFYDLEGRPMRSTGTVQDVTERTLAELKILKLNRVYVVIRSINQLIVRSTDRQALFDEACRIAVEHGLFKMAWVGLVDEEAGTVKPVACAGCDEAYMKLVEIALTGGPEGMGPTGRAVASGTHYINNDTATDPAMTPWRDAALARGYLSSAAFPLVVGGRAVGAFSVYAGEVDFFDEGEVSLLDELAGDLSFSLLSMESDEKRKHLEGVIKRGKEEWEQTFDAITDPIMLLDTNYSITRVNKAMAEKLGTSVKEAIGMTCYKSVHGTDEPPPFCPYSSLLANSEPHETEVYEERLGGYFIVSVSPLYDAGGKLSGCVHYARDITERKLAEEKLRLANALVENSATILFRWKAEEGWPVEYVSNNVIQLGYAPDELLSGRVKFASIVHPDDIARVAEEVSRFTAEGTDRFEQEYRVVTGGGEVRWLDDRTVVERDAGGAVKHYQGIVVDITERKRMEEALLDNAKTIETFFNHTISPMVFLDREFNFIRVNEAYARACRRDISEFAGRNHFEMYPSDARKIFERVVATREPYQAEAMAFTYPDHPEWGDTYWDWLLIPVTGGSGEVELLVWSLNDVTERKLAEDALKDSERRLRLILDAAFDGILVADTQTHGFTLGNKAICDMLGYSQDELLTIRVEDIHPPESLPEVMRKFELQLRGELRVAPDMPVKPKDGPVFYADIATSTTEIAGRASIVGVFHDVSERRLAEAALKNEAAVTSALLDAAKVAGGNLVWDEVAGSMAGLLLRFTGGKGVFIFTLERDGMLIPQKAAGVPEEELASFYALRVLATDIGLFRKALSAKKTLRFDSDSLPMYIDECHAGPLRLREAVITPIPVRDDVAGFILINYDCLPDDPRVAEIIEGIARQLGVAHDNSRLFAETQNKSIELARSIETLKVLSDIDKRILSTLDRDEMMTGALSQIRRVAPADIAGVLLADEDAGALRFAYGWSLGMRIGDTVPFAQCSGYQTLKTGKTLVRMDLAEEPDPSVMDRFFLEGGIKSDIFVPIVCKEKGFGLLHVGSYRIAGFSMDEVVTVENLARQMGIALENTRLISDVEEMFIGVVTAMASAIDAKSPWTKGHSERVTNYAMMTAEKMGLGQKEMDDLRLGGLLHDIGKIGTYDEVLNKPGRLTDDEFAMIRKHPEAGAVILGPIKQFKDIIPIIRHHHERWDGRGYPVGLAGEAIPLLARILCVADSFDSMTADRPYRSSLGFEFAVDEINRCAGSQFDPEVAKVFVEMLEDAR